MVLFAPSKDSDQPAHLHTLIKVFEGHSIGCQGIPAYMYIIFIYVCFQMNIRKALEKVIEWQAAASQLKPYLPVQDKVLTTWFKTLQEFKKDLPVLHKLANDALKVSYQNTDKKSDENKTISTNLYPPTKGYLRETCKSQNINPIYLTLSSPSVSFRS